jgi:hypothetical protein
MGIILYQVGSFLGETWGMANEGLKQSSQTLLAAQDTVDATISTVRLLDGGIGDVSAAVDSIGEGLISAERTTDSVASSLAAIGSSFESAGSFIPPSSQLGMAGSNLREAGFEARVASVSMNSLSPVWQDLQEESDSIKLTLGNARTELPRVQSSLTEVSQGLEVGAVALNSIASDLEILRGSGLFLWIFIGGLVYFSAVSLCLMFLGLSMLASEPH